MAEVKEITIFREELGRLLHDYERCSDKSVKNLIKEDILLIRAAMIIVAYCP
ncbi:hypothetical protein [Bacillus massilinigeriensis]|uniref:hypothetical protein n=1 Tax=Bacillus mediterraneensis TaxID=1805474 RepID=UPI00190ECBBE|nr:hypothetical protein [Bacillus mediterraneensis]